jgi:Lsr2
MKLTVDSDEPLERVLEVVGSLYGVRLSVDGSPARSARSASTRARTTRATRGRRPAKKTAAKKTAAKKTAAKKASPRRARRGSVDAAAVRAWARDNGLPVRERGRVPAEIVQAYTASGGR